MPHVITVANQKGGAGKSTVVYNLYQTFKRMGTDVVMVDTDPQGTLMDIDSEGVLTYDAAVPNFLLTLANKVVLVDTPPYLSELLPGIFAQSNVIIIPTRIGIADVLAIRQTIAMVKEAISKDPQLVARILFNSVKSGTTLTESVKEQMMFFNIPIFRTYLLDRVNITRSLGSVNGIFDFKDSKAEDEMSRLSMETLLALHGITSDKEITNALKELDDEIIKEKGASKNSAAGAKKKT